MSSGLCFLGDVYAYFILKAKYSLRKFLEVFFTDSKYFNWIHVSQYIYRILLEILIRLEIFFMILKPFRVFNYNKDKSTFKIWHGDNLNGFEGYR
jgi:hypothetical protein